MATKDKDDDYKKTVATHRKARQFYEIIEVIEAGLQLRGPEVKSLRKGQCSLDGAITVAVGNGINVNHERIPEELSAIATSLRIETGRAHSRVEIVARLLRHLDSYYNRFLAEGPESIVARFSEVSSYARGKRVRVATSTETYMGTTEGLEPGGLLRVRREDGRTLPVIAGTLSEAD